MTNSDLSTKQRLVASHLLEGKSNKEIAKILDVAPSTVISHLNKIYKKLSVHNRLSAAMKLVRKEKGE